MTWFLDLVDLSVQVPLYLPLIPNLLSQPFNKTPHNNLENLNLHAWLLGPRESGGGDFLKQWQQGLRHLRDVPPGKPMRASATIF